MISQIQPMPNVLSGARIEFSNESIGRVSYYVDGPNSIASRPGARPILLIHSQNATASAHEILPLYDACKARRRTYALDLPGFGHSERSDRFYSQALMVEAIVCMVDRIIQDTDATSVDALAVSLSSECLAKVAIAAPERIATVALISPTGFARYASTIGPPDATMGRARVLRVLKRPGIGRTAYRWLTKPISIRFFLRKTWGSSDIDERFYEHACRMSLHPGARYAPLHFIAGYLFSADIMPVYQALQQPVWFVHGVRGDFNDYSRKQLIEDRPNWTVDEYPTGALPYFEATDRFNRAYEEFIELHASTRANVLKADQS